MEDSFVDDLIAKAQLTPYFHLPRYMNRWWLTPPTPTHSGVTPHNSGYCSRIHQILRSDNDRHRHDHPWDYTSIILRGIYLEETEFGTCEYRPGHVLHRKATDAHKLILPYGPVWTLFICGPYKQRWGFITENGKVDWRTYLGPEAVTEYESNNPF